MTFSQRVGLLGILVMAAAILTAWGFQVLGGYVPCALCLEQRVPYYIALPIALLALLMLPKRVGRIGMLIAALVILYSTGLGVYHAGAEWGYWPGPADCGGGEAVRSASDLLASIEATNLVSCTDASGRYLGISFAGWNVIATLVAAMLLVAAAAIPGRRE